MTELKLAKLANRTPIRMTIMLSPNLHAALSDYASLYEQTYGSRETVADLVPAMLSAFLEGDRAFTRRRFSK